MLLKCIILRVTLILKQYFVLSQHTRSDPTTVKLGFLETKHNFMVYDQRRRGRRWHD